MTDRKPTASVVDMMSQAKPRIDAALLESCVLKARENLHVLAAPDACPMRPNGLTPETLQNISGLARGEYDFVILDVGRTLDPTSVKALDMADVHLPDRGSCRCRRFRTPSALRLCLQGLGYPTDKLNVVVNRYEKHGASRLDEVEQATQIKVARTVPAAKKRCIASINQGVPLLMLVPRDAVTRALAGLGQRSVAGADQA